MALNPADRYQRVSELSDDIQAYIEERPVTAAEYSWTQRAGKWTSRNKQVVRPVALTASLALLALGVGALVRVNWARHITRCRSRGGRARECSRAKH